MAENPSIITSDLDVAQQLLVGSNKSDYRKADPELQGVMSYWGISVLVAEGDVWKKHRRIVGPAFNNDLSSNVWLSKSWEDKKSFEVTSVQRLMSKFAFFLIGRCGFGFPFSWADSPNDVTGKITSPQAMRIFIDDIHLLHLPKWTLRLPFKKFKHMKECLAELKQFMELNIKEKEDKIKTNDGHGSSKDIFTMLVQANHLEKDKKLKLDDVEFSSFISDVFIMLLAGHETTAYLAQYPDCQQETFEQVIGADRDPIFEDHPKLNKVQACFYEGIRLFSRDIILHVPNAHGREGTTTIAAQKGTQMVVDMVGLHLNPKHYEDPEEFKPSKWYNISNKSESVVGFGLGNPDSKPVALRAFKSANAVISEEVELERATSDWQNL
ncbi:cytochrome P450 [Cyathus striatus]|nr:cytochrome P450 [Cyathus striatus]